MRLKLLFILFTTLLVYSTTPKKISAHFDESDGDATVTLHIDPNDNPIAGKKADLYFLIDDSQEGFKLSECNCSLKIYEKNNQIYNYKLTDKNGISSVWGVKVPFTFPKNDIYHIVLRGIPKKNNSFRQFLISWDFKVDPVTPGLISDKPSDRLIIIIVSSVGFILLLIGGFIIKKEIIDEDKKENNK